MIDPAEARKHAQQYRVELGRLTQTAPMVIEAMAAEIDRLRAALTDVVKRMESNGMGSWPVVKKARIALALEPE